MIEFSIIVPFFNSEKYIKKCIDSIINQTYNNWELILVNDGSTDNSLSICKDYLDDKRIRLIDKKNEGVSCSRNIGIKNAVGKRLLFLDSDDMIIDNTLSILSKKIQEYDYDVIAWSLMDENGNKYSFCENICVAKEFDKKNLENLRYRAFSGYSFDGVKDNAMHFIVTKAIKRDLLINNNIFFNEKLKYHEDTLFCIETMNKAKSILTINDYLYLRSIHDDSASCSYYNNIVENNVLFLYELKKFILNHYKNDRKYEVAYAKYQFSSFFQCLKLDFYNKKASYSDVERDNKIKLLLNNSIFLPSNKLLFYKIELKYKIIYFIFKIKSPFLIKIVFNSIIRS